MIPADETFDGTWPFAPHYFEGSGFKQHYVDEADGDPIICLHGAPTWGRLYRNFIPPLSEEHRVIVPDHRRSVPKIVGREMDKAIARALASSK